MKEFRLLKAHEIDVRIGMSKETGSSLLLYKDARADMTMLDEIVGVMNWKRTHDVVNGNLFCSVSIWDDDKKIWVTKQDVGTESNAEAEKGQASDSFKRACVNWGIGRELYTAPFIWIQGKKEDFKFKKFKVSEIEYNENREINRLTIVDDKGIVMFNYGSKSSYKPKTKAETPSKPKQQTKPVEDEYTRDDVFELAYQKGIEKGEAIVLWKKQFGTKADTANQTQIKKMLELIGKVKEFAGTPLE